MERRNQGENRHRGSPSRRQRQRSEAVEVLEDRRMLTLTVSFNYSLDTSGFFSNSGARAALERVGDLLESRIGDDLAAITPGGGNTWTAILHHPSTGNVHSIKDLGVPANTLVIFVGARSNITGNALAAGGPGSFGSYPLSNTSAFINAFQTRGEAGMNISSPTRSTDFGLWGGSLTFDTGTTWHFGAGPPSGNDADFESMALHEMGHLLGFGIAGSWQRLVSGSGFAGPASRAANGGTNVPLSALAAGHWADDISSVLPGTSTRQEASLTRQIILGNRKHYTEVDWAGLKDIGWEVNDVEPQLDWGDAPDASSGTGAGNYNTTAGDGGPSHVIGDQLRLGAAVDADNGSQQNTTATADGADENGVPDAASQLTFAAGAVPSIGVTVTNEIGDNAVLYGWIDYNGNGVFENATERAQVVVPDNTTGGTVTLVFPTPPANTVQATFARFRISTTTAAAASPVGPAPDGEVEDYAVTILTTDIDNNSAADLFTDGILIARYMVNFQGTALTNGAVGNGAARTSAAAIADYLKSAPEMLDADGNGTRDLFTDGILIARYLVGFSGDALIAGAIGPNATRTTAAAIATHLSQYPAVGTEPAPLQAESVPAESDTAAASRYVTAASTLADTDDALFTDLGWIDDASRMAAPPVPAAGKTNATMSAGRPVRAWLQLISGE